jgi:transcriptional regulator with XRE-family HTH domain
MSFSVDATTGVVNNRAEDPIDAGRRRGDRSQVSDTAERIRRLIETRGMSARSLSEAAGLSHSTVSSLLAKLDANPDARVEARTLDKVAAALEVDATWLRTGRGEMDGGASPQAPDIQSDMRSGVARFLNLANWPALLRAAKSIEPTLPEWVWQRLATAAPVLTAPPTPSSVAELARYILRHETPPVT